MATCPIDSSAFDSPLWIQIRETVVVTNETDLVIVEGRTILKEIPRRTEGVVITDGGTPLTEIRDINATLGDGEFRVDYTVGWIFFNSTYYADGTSLDTFQYTGRGIILYPYERIITQNGDLLGDGINEVYSDGVLVASGIGKFDFRQNITVVYDPLDPNRIIINADADAGFGGAFIDLSDAPSTYVGQKFKVVNVNEAESGVEFTDIDDLIGLIEPSIGQNVPYAGSIGTFGESKSGSSVAIKGANIVNEFLAYGRTLDWLIDNPDFRFGTDNFDALASTMAINSDGNMEVTGNGSGVNITLRQAIEGIKDGIEYFEKTKVRVTNSDALYIRLWLGNGQLIDSIATPTANEWYELSAIATASADNTFKFYIETGYPDVGTANGKVTEVEYIIQLHTPSDITTVAEMEDLLDGTIRDKGTHSAGEAVDVINILDNKDEFSAWATKEFTVDKSTQQDNIPYQKYTDAGVTLSGEVTAIESGKYYTIISHILKNTAGASKVALTAGSGGWVSTVFADEGETGIRKDYLLSDGTTHKLSLITGTVGSELIIRQAILEGDWTHLTDEDALQVIQGQTLTEYTFEQVVVNPDFIDDASWDISGGSTLTVINGVANFLADSQYDNLRQSVSRVIDGEKIYFACFIRATVSGANDIQMTINDGVNENGSVYYDNSKSGEWQLLSGIRTISSGATINSIRIYDNRTSGWSNIEIGHMIEVPSGDKSLAEMNTIIGNNVWEGEDTFYAQTERLSGVTYKTVAKNKFNLLGSEKLIGTFGEGLSETPANVSNIDYADNSITFTTVDAFRSIKMFASVMPSTDYIIHNSNIVGNVDRIYVNYLDINKNEISADTSFSPSSYQFTTPDNCRYIAFGYSDNAAGTFTIEDIQLELGTTATTYEKYRELYAKWHTDDFGAQGIGGVFDDNKVQRFGVDYNKVVKDTTSWTSAINILTVRFRKDLSELGYKKPISTVVANISLLIGDTLFPALTQSALDGGDSEGVSISDSNDNLYIRILQSRLGGTTSGDFETYLQANDVKFIYELATPISRTEKNNNLTPITGGLIIDAVGTYEQSGNGVIGDFKVTVPLNVYAQLVLNIITDLKQQAEINGLQKSMAQVIAENVVQFEQIGYLPDLDTATRTSLVAAINEVVGSIGDLADLDTSDKTSIVSAINELVYQLENAIIASNVEYVGAHGTFGIDADGNVKDIFGENVVPLKNASGRDLEFLLSNPDFRFGTDDWQASLGTITVVDGVLEYEITATSATSGYISQPFNRKAGQRYYLRLKVLPLIANELKFYDGTTWHVFNTVVANEWNTRSMIFTQVADESSTSIGSHRLAHDTLNYSIGEVVKFADIEFIKVPDDLTTVAEMEARLTGEIADKGLEWVGKEREYTQEQDKTNDFGQWELVDCEVDKETEIKGVPYLKFTQSATPEKARVATNMLDNTVYTLFTHIIKVYSPLGTAELRFADASSVISGDLIISVGKTGLFKDVFTTKNPITTNAVQYKISAGANGDYFVFLSAIIQGDKTGWNNAKILDFIKNTKAQGGSENPYKQKGVFYDSIGKNGFNVLEYQNLFSDYDYIDGAGYRVKRIKVKPNTNYVASFNRGFTASPITLVNSTEQVNNTGFLDLRNASNEKLFTSNEEGYLYIGNIASIDSEINESLNNAKLMLEIKDSLPRTEFEEYKSLPCHMPYELHGLGDSGTLVQDDLDVQRFGIDINDVVQNATTWLYASFTNVDRFSYDASVLGYKEITATGDVGNFSMVAGNNKDIFVAKALDDISTASAGYYITTRDSDHKIYIALPVSLGITTTGLLEAYLQANDVTFIYELETELPRLVTNENNNYEPIEGLPFSEKSGTFIQSGGSVVDKFTVDQPLNLAGQVLVIADAQREQQIQTGKIREDLESLEAELERTNETVETNSDNREKYTYNSLLSIGLVNADFGTNFVTSINVILTALDVMNSTGSAEVLSYISTTESSNLVGDINTELGLSETGYSIKVSNVRGENSGEPALTFSNKVEIIAGSTGSIYVGTFDTDLTPDITMIKIAAGTFSPVELMSAKIDVSSAPSKPVANITLTESIDNFDAIDLVLSVSNSDEQKVMRVMLHNNGDAIKVDFGRWALVDDIYFFTLERDTITTMTAYAGMKWDITVGSPAAIASSASSLINIEKIIGISY